MNNELGSYLEQVRLSKKLSLREAADRSGLSYTYIRDIELGMNRKTKKEVIPSPATLKKLADAYRVDYYELLEKAGVVDEYAIQEASNKISRVKEEIVMYTYGLPGIPLIGTICAGDGLLAEQNIEEYIHYPFRNKRQPDFALRVKGDSMIGAGIEDGDIVYMRQAPWADYNGQIVAALINECEEGTLKRIRWSSDSPLIRLEPENDEYQTIEVAPNEVRICGVYMGHFKPEREV